MRTIPVRSTAESGLEPYRGLTDVALRSATEPAAGIFLAEGRLVIERAVDAGYQILSVLTEERWVRTLPQPLLDSDTPVYVGSEALLKSITGYRVHRGALASVARPGPRAEADFTTARRLLLLEDLVDHTNVGALFRVAAALAIEGVLISPACADPLYRRSVKVSMGAVLTLPWARSTDWAASLARLGSAGFTVLGLTPRPDASGRSALPLADLAAESGAEGHFRPAIMVGTEGTGLSEMSLGACAKTVRIPMAQGIDSLNVATAAAVACYALGPAGQL